MRLDLNPIEHIWDMLGHRIQAREPTVQNIRQLEAALHREWQQLSQQDIPSQFKKHEEIVISLSKRHL
jgi:transposase